MIFELMPASRSLSENLLTSVFVEKTVLYILEKFLLKNCTV